MSMSNKHDLRRLVRSLLEAAVVGKAAASRGLALYVRKSSTMRGYILYSPENFAKKVENINNAELLTIHYASPDILNIVVGFITVMPHKGECWNAAEVRLSAAEKGYGPLMYELVMSDYGVMMSDHGAGTSDSARKVWQKYDQRSDVKKLPFDDEDHPKTPPKEDDCKILSDDDDEIDYLNQAYAGQGDSSGKELMIQNHEAFINEMQEKDYSRSDVEKALKEMADSYFNERY